MEKLCCKLIHIPIHLFPMKSMTVTQNTFKLVASTCQVYELTYLTSQMITSKWHYECEVSQGSK